MASWEFPGKPQLLHTNLYFESTMAINTIEKKFFKLWNSLLDSNPPGGHFIGFCSRRLLPSNMGIARALPYREFFLWKLLVNQASVLKHSRSTSDLPALVKPLQRLSLQFKHLFPPFQLLYNNSLLFPVDISIWQVFRQVRWVLCQRLSCQFRLNTVQNVPKSHPRYSHSLLKSRFRVVVPYILPPTSVSHQPLTWSASGKLRSLFFPIEAALKKLSKRSTDVFV